jgi:hypothetical protein
MRSRSCCPTGTTVPVGRGIRRWDADGAAAAWTARRIDLTNYRNAATRQTRRPAGHEAIWLLCPQQAGYRDGMSDELPAAAGPLLRPARLWTREEVVARPSPVPAASGVYAWYFSPLSIAVDSSGCAEVDGRRLLYVGISPKPPPANGAPPSRQQLRSRLRQHFAGNAAGSTLRLTLGCLLAGELGLQLRRVGSGRRLTFADGERVLSAWMATHAAVCWRTHPRPWEQEQLLVAQLDLPLNLHDNARHSFYPQLRDLRAAARATARALPVWTPTPGAEPLLADKQPPVERA